MKVSLPALAEMKITGEPIVMITAYDHATARIVDRCGVDLVLVGDSAANTVLGHDPVSTVGATMDELLILTRAVARGCERALVIGDLPFMSYQVSNEEAVRNAGRFIKESRADAVKLEGGGESVRRAAALKGAGIPVMGHVGLTPQTATMLGGHKAQGREWHQARQVYEDAVALQAAGCFAIVLECVPATGGRCDHAPADDPHDRYRCGCRHRRPGAGDSRSARHPPGGRGRAQVRQALCRGR